MSKKSKGSLILTAALELSTNQVTHFYSEKKNTEEMIKLLNIIIKKYAEEKTIYFSWDAASWHVSKALYKVVDEINSVEHRKKHKTPKIILVPLPTCTQFLNIVESVFSEMARALFIIVTINLLMNVRKLLTDIMMIEINIFWRIPKKQGIKFGVKKGLRFHFLKVIIVKIQNTDNLWILSIKVLL